MENSLRDAAKRSLMIWRREQLKKGAHEHFSNHTLYFKQFVLFQYLCASASDDRKFGGTKNFFLTPGLKKQLFLPLPRQYPCERDLGQ